MEYDRSRKMKDFMALRPKQAELSENRVKPDNNFLEFKKEDIQQAVSQRFEEQVKKYPDKIAVKSNKSSLTYNCLNHSARRTAQSIQKFFGGSRGAIFQKSPPGRRRQVALLFSHGADMIAGIIGVLKAGKVYVPLDPGYPGERLVYILKDADVGIIVTHDKHYKLAERLGGAVGNPIPVINIGRIEKDVPGENPGIDIKPGDPAYILYTSGSTGRPKGVMQSQRNVLHFARVYTNALHINKDDRLTLLSFYGFDAAKMDIFGALLNGATLYPFDLKREGGPARLPGWMEAEGITIYHSIPTVYRYFTDMLGGGEEFKTLRFIVLGGEAVYRKDIEIYKQHFSQAIFINGLGPTESTVTLQYFMDKETEVVKESVPVGYPAAETEVLLIGENNRLIKRLGVGEILYKSEYLALGYVNLPGKTHDAFGPDPVDGEARVFRSGDLGRRLKDGSIEYAGRKDFQFKVRGFRVEPAEIEGRMDRAPGIKKSAVVCLRHSHADRENYLAAYYTTYDGKDIDEDRLIAGLKETLPDYMVPDIVMRVEAFPLTATGKIDRGVLAQEDPSQLLAGLEYEAPADELETALAEVWQEVLRLERVGVTDNFFVLGGNSLKAIVLTAEIHKALEVKISLADIFRLPTVREVAGHIKASSREKFTAVEPVEKKEFYPLSSAQRRLYFIRQAAPNNTAYNMPLVFPLGKDIEKDKLESALNRLIARHESLRTSFIMAGEQPVQRIHDNAALEIEYACISENFIRPFELSKPPLLRSAVIETPDGDYTWLVDMHHIISDGTSHAILTGDFIALYRGEALKPLRLQYKDFSQWQNRLFAGGGIKAQQDYWLDLYRGEIPRLNLPQDYKRPGVFTFAGRIHQFKIDAGEAVKFKALASRGEGTLYMNILAVLDTLFYKYTGQTDIIIGTGIAGRPHADLQRIIGMFVNTLPMRNYPGGEKTYEYFLKEVIDSSVKAFENQDVQLEELIDGLELERNPSRNPLFDILMVVQNFEDETNQKLLRGVQGGGFLEKSPPGRRRQINITTAKFDMTFFVREAGEDIYIQIQYYTAVFKEESIRRLVLHFKNIVKTIIEKPSIKLKDIEIITEAEKRQVLYEFNDTTGAYPRDKTIHELFEEQAGKAPNRTAIVGPRGVGQWDIHLTYGQLNRQADFLAGQLKEKGAAADTIVGVMSEPCADVITGILAILKAGGAYLSIGPGYPEERRRFMLADSGAKILLATFNDIPVSPVCSVAKKQPANSLAYVIYTSGSTGKPRGVLVEHRNVVRLVKNTGYIEFREGDRLLQTGALEFDASTFEIWGVLLNGSALFIVGKEEILTTGILKEKIRKYNISIMWLTSPFFNRLSGEDIEIFEGLRNLLVGGDVLSPYHINRVIEKFPGLTVINGYGPTENTTFSTTFAIDREYAESIPIGKPIANSYAYILDRWQNPVPAGVVGELCVGGDGVARGYLNNPGLTAKRFNPAKSLYKTGDLSRWLSDGNIEFLGRSDQQVKIRGYRIELEEIENRLLRHPGVREAVVIDGEDDSGEKYLCAYLTAQGSGNVENWREFLAQTLPGYMIPSYFTPVEKIPLTANGKVDRKALPEPGITTGHRYAAPGNEIEKKLAAIWAEVLKGDRDRHLDIGIDDNFFDLGGHSLKAMAMIAKIHEELDAGIPLVDVFEHQTIRELSGYIRQAGKSRYYSIEPAEKKEYYALSPAQKRLFFIQQMVPGSTVYNMQMNIPLGPGIEIEGLKSLLKQLIARHDSLRTSFETIDGQPVQRVHKDVKIDPDFIDSIEAFTRPFDLTKAPLLRTGIVKTPGGHRSWLIDMHHIITDGTSQEILSGEFKRLYSGEKSEPPRLRIQYKDYAEWINKKEQQAAIKNQEEYWLKTLAGELPVMNLPLDYPRPAVQSFAGGNAGFRLEETLVKDLKRMAGEYGVTLYMVLLAVFTVFLSRLAGQEDVIVGTPAAGRRHANLQNIIGMFVNTLPNRNFPTGEKTFTHFLTEVKQNTIALFENQDYPFEDLVDKLGIERDTGRHPVFGVVFNLLNPLEYKGKVPETGTEKSHRQGTAKFDLLLTAMEIGAGLSLGFEYCTKLFKPATIDRFSGYFKKALSSLVENPSVKLSAIDIIDEGERNKLLFEFNRREAEYPGDKTIHQLFEEQAEKTPDSIALCAVRCALSYKELNTKSNGLAYSLKEKGGGPGTITAVMMERSLEMIIGILAILKTGGAYLPIDPASPEERQQYMLTDSSAKILLTTEVTEKKSPSPFTLHPSPSTPLAYIIYTSGSTGKPKGVPIIHANVSPLLHWGYDHLNLHPADRAIQILSYYFDWSVWEIFITLTSGASLYIIGEEVLLNPGLCIDFIDKYAITVLHMTPTQYRYIVETGRKLKTLKYLFIGAEKLTVDLAQRSFRSVSEGCRVFNMYGPTEATIISAVLEMNPTGKEQFKNLSSVPIGKPVGNAKLLILDNHLNLSPLNVTGELYIGGAGLSCGYLNNPELTNQKFCGGAGGVSPRFSKEPPARRRPRGAGSLLKIYRTGDLARWLADGTVEFLGRIDHQVKIRGYRIELGEIERQLIKHKHVKAALVLTVGDSDKYLCAYVVPAGGVRAGSRVLKEYLSRALPNYMVPTSFVEIEKIPLTANGKVDLKALPGPGPREAGQRYIAPRNEIEEKLAETWADILGLDKGGIGIDDNFFSLGGHSLKATVMQSKINKELNVLVSLAEIFNSPTIRELAAVVREAEITGFMDIDNIEKREFYQLSYSQKRLWIIQQVNPSDISYHLTASIAMESNIDRETVEKILHTITRRHESLRTRFKEVEGQPVQFIAAGIDIPLKSIDISSLAGEEKQRRLEMIFMEVTRTPFDLSSPPLFRSILVKEGEDRCTLIFNMHHIISDGWSQEILKRDFLEIYEGFRGGERVELKPLVLQYKDFAAWHHRRISDPGVKEKAGRFWAEKVNEGFPVLQLPYDYNGDKNDTNGAGFRIVVPGGVKQSLKQLAKDRNTTLFMVMFSAYNWLLSHFSGQEDIVCSVISAGRGHASTRDIVGFFINSIVAKTHVDDNEGFEDFLRRTAGDLLEAFQHQWYPLEQVLDEEKLPYPEVSVSFNMLSMQEDAAETELEYVETIHMETTHHVKFDITLLITEYKNGLELFINYKKAFFVPETIESFSESYVRLLSEIASGGQGLF